MADAQTIARLLKGEERRPASGLGYLLPLDFLETPEGKADITSAAWAMPQAITDIVDAAKFYADPATGAGVLGPNRDAVLQENARHMLELPVPGAAASLIGKGAPKGSLLTFGGVNAKTADKAALKTAQDMAEGGATKLFRGTTGSTERIKGGIGEGLKFATPFEDVARNYGDKIETINVSPSARILVEGTKEFSEITGRKKGPLLRTMRKGENLKTAADDAIEKARAAGYHAVEFNSMRDMGTAIIDEDALRGFVQSAPYKLTDESASKLSGAERLQIAQRNAALPKEQGGLGLPADNTPEMRAQAMGFDTDAYHGTASDIDRFGSLRRGESTKARSARAADWMTDNAETANGYADFASTTPVQKLIDASYAAERRGDWDGANNLMAQAESLEQAGGTGQNILPVKLRGTASVFDADEMSLSGLDEGELYSKLQEAKAQGADYLRVDNFSDEADWGVHRTATHYGVPKPKNIRSRFAAFDPARTDSADLLAANPTAAGLAAILKGENAEPKKQPVGLVPFDPAIHTAQDVGLGGPSTEYLTTDMHPEGGAFNYPSIWWDESGSPRLLEGEDAYDQAIQYEQQSGQRFPYYPEDTLENLKTGKSHAVEAAINRSANGGASNVSLANLLGSI